MHEKMEAMLRGRMFKKLMEHRCSPVCDKYGLKQIEVEILFYMSKVSGSTTSTNIYRGLNVNKGQISMTMESLCQKGYLAARSDETDRRLVLFDLTDQAKEVVEEIRLVTAKFKDDIFEGISEEELARFKETGLKILANANAMMEKEM